MKRIITICTFLLCVVWPSHYAFADDTPATGLQSSVQAAPDDAKKEVAPLTSTVSPPEPAVTVAPAPVQQPSVVVAPPSPASPQVNSNVVVSPAPAPNAAVSSTQERRRGIINKYIHKHQSKTTGTIVSSLYPLPFQKQVAMNTRRIGLGFTGLADAFVMLGVQYGSQASLKLAKEIASRISQVTWSTSCELAKAKGSFPLFRDEYLSGPFVLSLPDDLQKKIRQQGMRNSHHNAIAPTGSISLLANNVSGGIEPIFAKEFKRNVRELSGDTLEFTIQDYAYHFWKKNYQEEPKGWQDVASLKPRDHLAIQGVVQPFIDNAISKTINIPQDYPLNDVVEIYSDAYKMGLKGCTIFRPNPITGSILSSEEIDPCCA